MIEMMLLSELLLSFNNRRTMEPSEPYCVDAVVVIDILYRRVCFVVGAPWLFDVTELPVLPKFSRKRYTAMKIELLRKRLP
jgi:hypothetical protein